MLGCMELLYMEFPLAAKGGGGCYSCKYAQLEEILREVATLPEELNRPHSTQECEQKIKTWYCALSQPKQQSCLKAVQEEGKPESNLELSDTSNSQEGGPLCLLRAEELFPIPWSAPK